MYFWDLLWFAGFPIASEHSTNCQNFLISNYNFIDIYRIQQFLSHYLPFTNSLIHHNPPHPSPHFCSNSQHRAKSHSQLFQLLSSLFIQRCSNYSATKYLHVSKSISNTIKRLSAGQRTITLFNTCRT